MNLDQLPINWFDLTVVLMLVMGILRGRKHGMSEELLYLVQWLAIIFGAAAMYEPGGKLFAQSTVFSLLFSYVFVYLAVAVVIKILFSLFKHGVGGKMIGSDIFGPTEYYLGMLAGMVRYACILIMFLSVLNARYFTPKEVKDMDYYQKDVYGSDFFPTIHSLQVQVFEKSLTGPAIKKYLDFFLIKPTVSEKKNLKRREFEFPQ